MAEPLAQCENMTDEELVELSTGNTEYFGCLMRRYEGKILRYIRRITNVSEEEAQDILQETFIKAYVNIRDFDTALKFSSWLYRIAHNQTISNYRKNKVRPQGHSVDVEDSVLNNIASELDIARQVDQGLLRKNIERVLEKMDEKYREVLVLRYLEEKDYKEISDILKKPMGTVATLLNRSKAHFKKALQALDLKV